MDGLYPHQRMGLKAALDAYTINPAIANGKEMLLGRIAPGFKADLIVLPCDPFRQDSQDLWKILPDLTLVDGRIAYQR